MALDFENSLQGLADLNLWFKLRTGEDIVLSDVPEIIRLRWPYFRDNWEFIKSGYETLIPTYGDSESLRSHIDLFSSRIV